MACCDCPNGSPVFITLVSIMSSIAFLMALSGFLWTSIIGLVAMVYILCLCCVKMDRKKLTGAGGLCLVAAIGQVVAAIVINEDSLYFCHSDQFHIDKDSAMCDLTLYRAMNGAGAALWVFTGVLVCILPEEPPDNVVQVATPVRVPHSSAAVTPHQPHVTKSVTTRPDGKSVTKTIVTNPDGSKTVTEEVVEKEFDDCNI